MNNKSVGIITIHKSLLSYGACLQSYALWKYIKTLGYECEIIDLYRPVMKGYSNNTHSLTFSTTPKNKKYNFKNYLRLYFNKFFSRNIFTNPQKTQRFQAFNSLIDYSTSYNSIDALYKNPPIYDYYISGSDQIWNPDMPFENEPYLLSFVPNGKKRISYASSFGRNNLPEKYKKHYQNSLKHYDSISVREESGKNIIKELIDWDSEVVLDPTMLFDANFWQTLSIQPNLKQKYLFCFSLHNNKELLHFASNICKRKGLDLVVISDEPIHFEKINVINVPNSGPKEWLGLVEKADFIITDSFHGTVFSILFEKQFLSFANTNNSETTYGSRIENLLTRLSLNNYLLTNLKSNFEGITESIDFKIINKTLKNLRVASFEYLSNVLK